MPLPISPNSTSLAVVCCDNSVNVLMVVAWSGGRNLLDDEGCGCVCLRKLLLLVSVPAVCLGVCYCEKTMWVEGWSPGRRRAEESRWGSVPCAQPWPRRTLGLSGQLDVRDAQWLEFLSPPICASCPPLVARHHTHCDTLRHTFSHPSVASGDPTNDALTSASTPLALSPTPQKGSS